MKLLTDEKNKLVFSPTYSRPSQADSVASKTINEAYKRKRNLKNRKAPINQGKNMPIDLDVALRMLQELQLKPEWKAGIEHHSNSDFTKIHVIDIPEMVWALTISGVGVENIVFVSDESWKKDWVEDYLLLDSSNIISYNNYKMKYTNPNASGLTIINPAWGLSVDALEHARKITKGPIAAITDAKLAKDLDWSKIVYYKYLGFGAFDVQLNAIFFIEDTNKLPTQSVVLEDEQGDAISVNCNDIAIPLITAVDHWKKANDVVAKQLPGYDFQTGSLDRKVLEKNITNSASGIPVIPTVGRSGEPLRIVKISKSLQAQVAGENDHKVVFGVDSRQSEIGPVKYAGPGLSVPNRVGYISCNSKAQADKIIKYLSSAEVQDYVSAIKVTAKNSKYVFSRIPSLAHKHVL